ncbi:LCP family protein [Oryzihumus sp.]
MTASVVALTLVAGITAYAKLNGKIHTFSSAGISRTRPKAAPAGGENILLIGSDTRSGNNSKLGGAGDAVGRSDTTLVVHIYPGHTRAVAVSIPRDSLVTIPACRLPDGHWTAPQNNVMFNSAFSVGQSPQGNPACTLNTVEKLTGLKIDHTVVANFAGFAALSKAVGGVPVCVPNAVYQGDLDPNRSTRGALLFRAGKQQVSGDKALQYVRIRHGLGDGSDIGRIQRQQAFLASLIMTIRSRGLTPSHLLPLVNAATANLTFDPSLGTASKLLKFAMSLRNFQPSHVNFVTVPWQYAGARVDIVQPDADHLFQALQANQPIDTQHKKGSQKSGSASVSKSVPVSVYNGTTTTGLAGSTGTRLQGIGYTVGTIGNAPRQDYAQTEVQYGPGETAQAKALAHTLSAKLRPMQTSGIKVILGAQHGWRGGHAPAQPLPSSVTGHLRSVGSAKSNLCKNLSDGR